MANDEDLRVQQLLATLERRLGPGGGREPAPRVPDVDRVPLMGSEIVAFATSSAAQKWGKKMLVGNIDESLVVLRPRWTLGRIPQLAIEPASTRGSPRREGDFLLWAALDRNRIYYALAVPRLLDVTVLIRRESVGNTIKITGGSVTLTVSAYDHVGPQTLQWLQDRWRDAIHVELPYHPPVLPPHILGGSVAPHRPLGGPVMLRPQISFPVQPSYVPLVLNGLTASLDMDPALLAGPPRITESTDVGTVTFVILLSELGAQVWLDALEAQQGGSIGGVCRISARYFANMDAVGLKVVPIELSAPLGTLLQGRGREILQVLDAQITVDAQVIVSGHQMLDEVTVDWRPSEGHRPEALAFGPEGGSFTAAITSPHVGQVTIDWSAKVAFKPVNWPVITRSGQLSFARNDTVLLLKPESWITTYSIFVVLIDAGGKPVAEADHAGDTENRVQCQVRFTAPFLEGGAAITEAFETSSQTLTEVAFPLPQGEAPGAVTLTVVAQLGGAAPVMKARAIKPWETFVMVKVTLAGAIEIVVNTPEGGGALESTALELAALRR